VLSADTIMLSLNKDFIIIIIIIIIIIRKLSHESRSQKIWHPPRNFWNVRPCLSVTNIVLSVTNLVLSVTNLVPSAPWRTLSSAWRTLSSAWRTLSRQRDEPCPQRDEPCPQREEPREKPPKFLLLCNRVRSYKFDYCVSIMFIMTIIK
jgi:hypothetical protein